MKTKTNVNVGNISANHNQARGLPVKTRVRAGTLTPAHPIGIMIK